MNTTGQAPIPSIDADKAPISTEEPAKDTPLSLTDVPEELRSLKQWVCWNSEERDGKRTKVPYSPLDYARCGASEKDLERWGTATNALKAMTKRRFTGVGFVFTGQDDYVGVDLDAALAPGADKVADWARPLLKKAKSYVELSVSGTGFHVVCRGKTSKPGAKATVKAAEAVEGKTPQIEIYSAGRFFVFTGKKCGQNGILEDQAFIDLVEATVEKLKGKSKKVSKRTTEAREEEPEDAYELNNEPLSATDQKLVARCCEEDPVFRDLWEGDISRFEDNHSDADFALISILLKQTRRDIRRTVRIFSASELGQREKWQERVDYRQRTVEAALEACPVFGYVPADEIEAAVVEQFGNPFETVFNKKAVRMVRVHEAFFAGQYALTHKIVWAAPERQFYQYDGATGLYSIIARQTIRESVSSFMLSMARRDWSDAGFTDWGALESARTARFLDAVVKHLEGIALENDPFPPDDRIRLHLQNGILVQCGGGEFAMEPFTPEIRSRNACPVVHDPAATAPKFSEALRRGMRDEADAEIVLRYMFQCIIGRNLGQRILVICGPADNGKTTLAQVILFFVGRNNCCELRPSMLEGHFELSRFIGKTLLMGSDVPGTFFSSSGTQRLKALVGGDWLNPERKNSNEVCAIRGEFNAVVTTNEKLAIRVNGDAGAWARRMLVVHHDGPPPVLKISHYAELLVKEEGAGILNLVLQAGRRFLADMATSGGFVLTASQQARVVALFSEEERFRAFLKACLELRVGSHVTTEKVLSRYEDYAEKRGWPVSVNETVLGRINRECIESIFGVRQSHSICDDEDDTAVRGYRGLAFIKDTFDAQDEP